MQQDLDHQSNAVSGVPAGLDRELHDMHDEAWRLELFAHLERIKDSLLAQHCPDASAANDTTQRTAQSSAGNQCGGLDTSGNEIEVTHSSTPLNDSKQNAAPTQSELRPCDAQTDDVADSDSSDQGQDAGPAAATMSSEAMLQGLVDADDGEELGDAEVIEMMAQVQVCQARQRCEIFCVTLLGCLGSECTAH